jgi:serine phosphatase RsbU (regulator of sigma subunit)
MWVPYLTVISANDILKRSFIYMVTILGLTLLSVTLIAFTRPLAILVTLNNIPIMAGAFFILVIAIYFQVSQTRISLQNARLAGELQNKQNQIEKDLKTAKAVQKAILHQPPQIEGYDMAARWEPASQLGGDFYDFFRKTDQNGNTKLGIVIGDVSGHGVSSALVATLTEGIINEIGPGTLSLKEMLAYLNTRLVNTLGAKHNHVTMAMALLDPQNHELEYALAGHPAPLIKNIKNEIKALPGSGTLLGLYENEIFESQKIKLEPGEALLFYTDGLTEARDPKAKELGENFLIDELRNNQIAKTEQALNRLFEKVSTIEPAHNP